MQITSVVFARNLVISIDSVATKTSVTRVRFRALGFRKLRPYRGRPIYRHCLLSTSNTVPVVLAACRRTVRRNSHTFQARLACSETSTGRRRPETGSALYVGRSRRPRLPALVVTGPGAVVGRGVARRIRSPLSTDTTRHDRSSRRKTHFFFSATGGAAVKRPGPTAARRSNDPGRRPDWIGPTGYRKTSRRAGVLRDIAMAE